jgi:hypothetical protein
MRNYKILENLYSKLEDWGIDPITLAKAIGIFLVVVIIVVIMVMYPVLFIMLLTAILCVLLIGLIYSMIE